MPKLLTIIASTRPVRVGLPVGNWFMDRAVSIPFVTQFLDDDRVIQANDVMVKAAADMLDELLVLGAALEPLRSAG